MQTPTSQPGVPENGIEDWIARIGRRAVPVLPETIVLLRRHCAHDNAPIAELVAEIEKDPGLVVHLLRVTNALAAGPLRSDVTSVQQALMMLGTEKVNDLPARLPVLDNHPDTAARERLHKTFARAYHAARQATDWARLRRDMMPDEVFAATQLHFLGEMFLSLYAPGQLDEVDKVQREQHISSEEAQYLVLGFTLDQLTARLARLWRLPRLVLEALHPENARFPRAYGIMLAVQLARAAAIDWYGEKTREIEARAAEWLDRETPELIGRIHRLAVSVARDGRRYQAVPAAARLPLIHVEPVADDKEVEAVAQEETAEVCLMPQIRILQNLLATLQRPELLREHAYNVISLVLKGMHDGIGLNRVVFARYDAEENRLEAAKIIGADNDPDFGRFIVPLDEPHLLTRLMAKTQAVVINETNHERFWPLVPEAFRDLVRVNRFAAMSVVIEGRPVGLFYADRHSNTCPIDERSYQCFKRVCLRAGEVLAKLPRLDFSEH